MEKFRRKAEVVEARKHDGPHMTVVHDELGEMTAHKGDYLVGSKRGQVRVISAAQFEKEFEPVDAPKKSKDSAEK